ncbi:MAG TPA: TAXI family TRAP transporter solute-binding subunit [Methylomirabilota bacterium]|nr:TAXI family TRAP transporter solute-binding subunit [Methylomirabilota bacterium]
MDTARVLLLAGDLGYISGAVYGELEPDVNCESLSGLFGQEIKMNTVKHRYSAEIQRAKGFLELAAALYDTSLSFQTTRAAEQAIQTESRVGYSLTLALKATREEGISFSFGADGFRELQAVTQGKLSVAWINPSVAATMAFRGKGLFSKRQPIRTIAAFPSYDVMAFAVHESTGVNSLDQIKKERIPLRLSTGIVSKSSLTYSPTMFTVSAVMKAAGFTFANLRQWGGKIRSVSRPSHPDRREAIEKGTINAIFDEGIKSWGQTAIDAGFRYLPVEGSILKNLTAIGYRPSVLPKSRFPDLPKDVPTVDFSGWPMVVRADMPEDVAYALCEAIEARKALMPTDNFKPLDMAQLCANDEEAPYDVPLHPGAKRFYQEKGYLKSHQ